MDIEAYDHIRIGGNGFIELPRGLIAVWGSEALQFLDGLITNDVKTLEDGQQMLAAFPNAQGRLLALVRVLRQGEKFFFETEEATREAVYQNLFRFTFAGDFFVEDLSEQFKYLEVFKPGSPCAPGGVVFEMKTSSAFFVPLDDSERFREQLVNGDAIEIDDETYEVLRIESGVPKYGLDMDENTIVPELGLDGLISYNKGCYIGQEIIARIHFRGHVAKQLTGLMFAASSFDPEFAADPRMNARIPVEITSIDGKNAGRITSLTYSPKLETTIALAFVRYEFLAEDTQLNAAGSTAVVRKLPFIS